MREVVGGFSIERRLEIGRRFGDIVRRRKGWIEKIQYLILLQETIAILQWLPKFEPNAVRRENMHKFRVVMLFLLIRLYLEELRFQIQTLRELEQITDSLGD